MAQFRDYFDQKNLQIAQGNRANAAAVDRLAQTWDQQAAKGNSLNQNQLYYRGGQNAFKNEAPKLAAREGYEWKSQTRKNSLGSPDLYGWYQAKKGGAGGTGGAGAGLAGGAGGAAPTTPVSPVMPAQPASPIPEVTSGGFLNPANVNAGQPEVVKKREDFDRSKLAPVVLGEVSRQSTVRGQLADMLNSNSDLMRLGARTGREEAQRRGLLNSSLAAEAAQLGMLREARPIAEADASTYFKQQLTNQDVRNAEVTDLRKSAMEDWLGYNKDARVSDLANQEASLKSGLMDQETALKAGLMTQEFGQDKEKMAQEYGLKGQLVGDEYGYKANLTSGEQNAALWAQFIQGAAEINKSDMSVADKTAQIEALKQSSLAGMASNAKAFGDEKMFKFVSEQSSAIDGAATKLAQAKTAQAQAETELAKTQQGSTGGTGIYSGLSNQSRYVTEVG